MPLRPHVVGHVSGGVCLGLPLLSYRRSLLLPLPPPRILLSELGLPTRLSSVRRGQRYGEGWDRSAYTPHAERVAVSVQWREILAEFLAALQGTS